MDFRDKTVLTRPPPVAGDSTQYLAAPKSYKFLWLTLHKLIYLAFALYWLGEFVLTKLREFLRPTEHTLEADRAYVEYNIRQLDRRPIHVVVLLTSDTAIAALPALVRIVFWSLAAGVAHVSFYDPHGAIKERGGGEVIRKEVVKSRREEDQVVWGNEAAAAKNGFKSRILVNFFGPGDGKRAIVEVCRELAETKDVGPEEIDVGEVDRRLRERLNGLPDPDLALYFGDICGTFGLLPWQVRLTEFISIGRPETFRRETFIAALRRFARCEQRLGK